MKARPSILWLVLVIACEKQADPPASPAAPVPAPSPGTVESSPKNSPPPSPSAAEPRIVSEPPPPPPKESETEIMDRLAAEKFDGAKKAYERQELFDAMEQAEESRRILSALASLYESQGQSGRVKHVSERIRHITEFIVLCRKTPGSKTETKPNTPESQPAPPTPSQSVPPAPAAPPAPPVSPKDAKELEAFYDAFIAALKSHKADRAVKSDDLVLRARLLARKESGSHLALIQTAVLILTALARQEWTTAPEEAGLLNAYAGKFPKPGKDVEAFDFLIDGLSRFAAPGSRLRFPVVRALALMHLDALRVQISVDPILVKHRATLELTDQFFAAESEAVEALRAAQGKDTAQSFLDLVQENDGIREPLYRTHRLLQLILATTTYKADEALVILAAVLAEVGRPAPYASFKPLQEEFKTLLASFKPCKWCSGTHQVNCDYRCQQGQVTKMCMVCSGTGKKPGYGDTRPCPEKYNHPHTWTEDCPRCKGTAHLPCRSCKAAWQEPREEKIVVRKRCELCAATGLLTSFRMICSDCHGIGSILTPAKKK
jgi:predicted transcriptional regulator